MKSLGFFIIQGKPAIKKNSRKIMRSFKTGKPFLGKTDSLKAAEMSAYYELSAQKTAQKFKMINFPVNIKFTFYLPTNRLPDLSNLYQLPEDSLQTAGILKNDNLIGGHDGSRRLVDAKNPRTEIEIFRL